MRALWGLLLLQYAIENMKVHNIDDRAASLKDINKLRACMLKKRADECKAQDTNFSKTVLKLQQQYNEFNRSKKEKSSLRILGSFVWYDK